MIISNMLFFCFRGSPIRLASAVPAKPHHVRCAGFCSDHFKLSMQKNESFIEKVDKIDKMMLWFMQVVTFSVSVDVPVPGVHVPQPLSHHPGGPVGAPPALTSADPSRWVTEPSCSTVNGAGSLPALISQLIFFGDSNHLLPFLRVEVTGDSNVLMPMLRVESDLDTPIVTFLPRLVDLSLNSVIIGGSGVVDKIDANVNVTFLSRHLVWSRTPARRHRRLLYARCARLRHNTQPATTGITNADLSDSFNHCSLTYCYYLFMKCEWKDDCLLTDIYINTYYALYESGTLFLEPGKPCKFAQISNTSLIY